MSLKKIKHLIFSPNALIKAVSNRLGIPSRSLKAFLNHNKRLWKDFRCPSAKSLILFDYYPMAETELVRTYFLNVHAKKFNAKIVSYSINKNIRSRIWDKVYRSLNVENHLTMRLSRKQKIEVKHKYLEIKSQLLTKDDLFNLKLEGVWIGVDIYEEYLMRYIEPTVNMDDKRINKVIKDGIEIFVFFRDFFRQNDVKLIDSSHIGVRLKSNLVPKIAGQLFNIPYYSSHIRTMIFYPEPHKYIDEEVRKYKTYHENFKKFTHSEQQSAVRWGKERLELRLSGKVGVDMSYSSASAYNSNLASGQVTKTTKNLKVLVCSHEFYDSPNCIGGLLFLDFYEWMLYLGKISKESNYDWYIKTHPDVTPKTEKIIKKFVDDHDNFSLIPPSTSFQQLRKEGVRHILTCHGSMGHECPLLGMTVINSANNYHMGYDFNINAKTLEEYEHIISNLDKVNKTIDPKEIYEFYYMHNNIYQQISDDWFFGSYLDYLDKVVPEERGGFKVFEYHLKNFSKAKHLKIISLMNDFIDSGARGIATKQIINV